MKRPTEGCIIRLQERYWLNAGCFIVSLNPPHTTLFLNQSRLLEVFPDSGRAVPSSAKELTLHLSKMEGVLVITRPSGVRIYTDRLPMKYETKLENMVRKKLSRVKLDSEDAIVSLITNPKSECGYYVELLKYRGIGRKTVDAFNIVYRDLIIKHTGHEPQSYEQCSAAIEAKWERYHKLHPQTVTP